MRVCAFQRLLMLERSTTLTKEEVTEFYSDPSDYNTP